MKHAVLLVAAILLGTTAASAGSMRFDRVVDALHDASAPGPRTLSDEMRAKNVPGVSIAVIRSGQIVWTRGYGRTNRGGAPIVPSTRFQAGSISKSITALGILRMAVAGQLSLDRPVNSYLTRWTLPDSAGASAKDVTLRGLLSHTAGINVHGFNGYDHAGPVPTLRQVLDGQAPANSPAIRIVATPGENYSYSGGGYEIAQALVEDVSGEDFGRWARDRILAPAGMTESDFVQIAAAPHALGHYADGRTVVGGYHLYPEQAAAGLWTTPRDIARAMLALSASLAGKPPALLPVRIARIVLVPVKPGQSVGFDTGGTKAAPWIAKGGDTQGFSAALVFFPKGGDGAIVMTNGDQGAGLADQLIHAIAAACHWPSIDG